MCAVFRTITHRSSWFESLRSLQFSLPTPTVTIVLGTVFRYNKKPQDSLVS